MHIDHQQVWETYTSAWKAESADNKRALFEASLARECAYQDPLTKVNGANAERIPATRAAQSHRAQVENG